MSERKSERYVTSQSSRTIFNNDLLANPDDVSKINDVYGPLQQVLYHQELVGYFNKYNDLANNAKTRSRTWGKRALALGVYAIALAVAEVVGVVLNLGNERFSFALGFLASCCGLLSIAIGARGILFGKRKQEWLVNRFVGERIRQFHFQSLIMQFPEIVGFLLTDDKADGLRAKFRSDRERLFKQFMSELESNIAARFNSVIGAYSEKDFWVHSSVGTILAGRIPKQTDVDIDITDLEPGSVGEEPVRIRSRNLGLFFEAYLHLRIRHQMGYADYKLGNDHRIFSSLPVRQAEVLEAVTKIGIAWPVPDPPRGILHCDCGLWPVGGEANRPRYGVGFLRLLRLQHRNRGPGIHGACGSSISAGPSARAGNRALSALQVSRAIGSGAISES
jgi:hypothetical protein